VEKVAKVEEGGQSRGLAKAGVQQDLQLAASFFFCRSRPTSFFLTNQIAM
jgi:hypothetical protein